jgi:hypothetical protein
MQRKFDDLWEESKKVALVINSWKKEEVYVNTTVNQDLTRRLNNRDIKRPSDLCYLDSVVSEDGGASTDISVRIQKDRRSFSKLRKVWLSTSIRKDTKIRIFNTCLKYVLLYGCETWFVASEIQHKIQTFVDRCLRYILRIWWPKTLPNKEL